MLRSTLARAKRRTSRSLAVSPPSLNTGWPNRLVVAISTPRPVSARALVKRSSSDCRVDSSGTRSSSWKVTAAAPSSASRCTASTGSSRGRTAPPKTSTPCQPTVQRPKLNLSSLVGVKLSLIVRSPAGSGDRRHLCRRRGLRRLRAPDEWGRRSRDDGRVVEHGLQGDVRTAPDRRGEAEGGQHHPCPGLV